MSSVWPQAAAVTIGGAFGALSRFAVNQLFQRIGYGGLPTATLMVNVIGCLCTGIFLVWVEQRMDPVFWRALLITGVMGGLTTFSALGLETWQLLRAERWGLIAATLTAHIGFGVLAVGCGWTLGQALWGART
ncbi:MAG: CrcB family protein [Luteimonas sp.]